jgi:anti-sigma regulatory factor (Ser/Thr protein kinase)
MLESGMFKWADIRSITLTKSGKLWLGTAQGLASFDGNEMVYISQYRNAKEGYDYQRIDKLADDGKGNLWFPYGRNLVKLDIKTGKSISTELPYFDSTEAKIRYNDYSPYLDKKGKLWLTLGFNGFVIYDTVTKIFEHYNFNPDKPKNWNDRYKNQAYYFEQDPFSEGVMWIAEYGDGIYRFDRNQKNIQKIFRAARSKDSCWINTKVTLLDVRNDSTIWFSTWGNGMGELKIRTGLYKMYPDRNSFYVIENGLRELTHGRIITSFIQKSDSEYLVACRDTLPAIFNIHTKKYSYINDEILKKGLPGTTEIKMDNLKNIWCLKGGKIFISSPRYSLFKEIPFTNLRPVSREAIELRDIIWDSINKEYYAAVLFSKGIYVFDPAFKIKKIIPIPFSHGAGGVTDAALVSRLRKDGRGRLWALGEKLFIYDSLSQRMKNAEEISYSLSQLHKKYYDFEFDSTGNMFLHSTDHELLIWNFNNNEIKEIKFPLTVKNNESAFSSENIVIDNKRGYLYVADGNAIYQYNLHSGTFKYLSSDSNSYDFLQESRIIGYAVDSRGNFWVQSDNTGIRIFEPLALKAIYNITTKGGITSNLGENIVSGPKDYMLFFTPGGGNLYSNIDSTFINFDMANGLLADVPLWLCYANQHFFFTFQGTGRTQYVDLSTLLSLKRNITPYLNTIKVIGLVPNLDTLPEFLHKLILPYNHSSVELGFSCTEFEFPERIQYAYKLDGVDGDWTYTNYLNRRISYVNIEPGNYSFHLKARMLGGKWTEQENTLQIIITPAWWQKDWFKIILAFSACMMIYLLVRWRIKAVRKQEQLKGKYEKGLLELEAKALRAQMNPHFIFNCMNSIKSLIQQKEEDKAVNYLTTFSKLIRTIFQNSDKREVTLFDEIETCRLYTQLESMRFGNKFSYSFFIDEAADLKSLLVPALIIQPFIENAIWHGIMPKEDGGYVNVTVKKENENICCIIDDNGIGIEMSKQNKFKGDTSAHQSRGVHLTQSRLDLDNLLNERKATLEITDKKDEQGKANGTMVFLTFKEY